MKIAVPGPAFRASMIPPATSIHTTASRPLVRPLASSAANSTSSVQVIAPATCTTATLTPSSRLGELFWSRSVLPEGHLRQLPAV